MLTGADLAARGCAWMPTLSLDSQAVLATDKVRFHGQEVAFVIAADRYAARDALELIDVDDEPLPAVVDPRRALDAGAPVIRDDLPGKGDNHLFDWESGDLAATERVFAAAEVVVEQVMVYPRSHPAPMETCGAVAEFDRVSGKLTMWSTTQAPHPIARCTPRSSVSTSTRSGSSPPTSAAASATSGCRRRGRRSCRSASRPRARAMRRRSRRSSLTSSGSRPRTST